MNPTIYLINLDKSQSRLKNSAEKLQQQNISFQRLSAIDGRELSESDLYQHYCKKVNSTSYHTALSRGEIGCYLSHRKAWRKIADGDQPYGIVLEDDFYLSGDLNQSIATINEINFPWDLIKLSAYQSRVRKINYRHKLSDQYDLVVHNKTMSGGAATAITKQAAKKLLEKTNKFGRPIDTDIQHFWEKDISVLSLLPYPIAQDMEVETTISDRKNRPKKYFWKRRYQQINSYLLNFVATKKVIKQLKAFYQR